MKVREIMKDIIAIDESSTIRKAAALMAEKKIGSLIVTSKDKLIGIVTEKDITEAAAKRILDSKISRVMTESIETISANDSIDNAAHKMAAKKIHRLPVIDKDKLVGIITATDILANSDSINEDFLLD